MNRFIEIFDSIFSSKQNRAVIQLGFWGLFLIFVFVYLNVDLGRTETGPKQVVRLKPIEALRKTVDYNAEIKIEGQILDYNSTLNSISSYNYNGLIKEDQIISESDNGDKTEIKYFFDFWYLSPANIVSLVEQGTLIDEKSYGTGEKIKFYNVSLNALFKFYKKDIYFFKTSIGDASLKLHLLEKDNVIKKVTIDLSTYYELLNNNPKEYIIEIEYK